METAVTGTVMPVLEVTLSPGDKLVAEAGQFSWLTQSVEMETTTQTGGAKGMMGVLKRAVGGGGLFMSEFEAKNSPGTVSFSTNLPGQILPITVREGSAYMVQRGGFICATEGISVTMGFQKKLSAAFFGGEGFVLQKLEGNAEAWIEIDGEVVIKDLNPGEVLRVHPGHVGMFEERVAFELTTVKGLKNKLFGDALFVAKLTGPGRVWLQSLTLGNLAGALQPYIDTNTGGGGGGSSAGNVIGGLFDK